MTARAISCEPSSPVRVESLAPAHGFTSGKTPLEAGARLCSQRAGVEDVTSAPPETHRLTSHGRSEAGTKTPWARGGGLRARRECQPAAGGRQNPPRCRQSAWEPRPFPDARMSN